MSHEISQYLRNSSVLIGSCQGDFFFEREISGLFETFGSDGSLQDTLKVSIRHYLKLSDSLFETFLI